MFKHHLSHYIVSGREIYSNLSTNIRITQLYLEDSVKSSLQNQQNKMCDEQVINFPILVSILCLCACVVHSGLRWSEQLHSILWQPDVIFHFPLSQSCNINCMYSKTSLIWTPFSRIWLRPDCKYSLYLCLSGCLCWKWYCKTNWAWYTEDNTRSVTFSVKLNIYCICVGKTVR
jgi:hypothetical protein